jgi:hypothetical protein
MNGLPNGPLNSVPMMMGARPSFREEERRAGSRRTPPRGLAQPYSSTTRDAPLMAGFTGGLLRTLPGMFIDHSGIIAFLLHRFSANQLAPLLWRWILTLYYHKLLSAPSASRHAPLSRSLPRSYGAGP